MDSRTSSLAALIFIVAILFFTQYKPEVSKEALPNYETIKIANWNMQTFGIDKVNNAALMNAYLDKIKNYDIIFLQEIKDISGVSPITLCNMLVDYNCRLSSRAGSTSSKEQYLVAYKKGIIINDFKDYNLLNYTQDFERPPIEVAFGINYSLVYNYNNSTDQFFNITIWNIHIKPDDAKNELTNLQSLISYKPNTMIIGDMNADCGYYNPKNETIFRGWNWLIKDGQDTTVSKDICTYDRMLVDNELFLRVINSGIDNTITKDQSDHYIVWTQIAKSR